MRLGERSIFCLLCLLVPAPAILLGAFVMKARGIQPQLWAQNPLAWIGCTVVFIAFAVKPGTFGQHSIAIVQGLSVATMLLTLASPGIAGVHRWLFIGPVRLHAAAIVAPAFLVGLASTRDLRRSALAGTLAMTLTLALQPDAAQQTGFALAAAIVLLKQGAGKVRRIGLPALAGVILETWLRPDPLGPVEYVEGILVLARTHGIALFVLAILSLLILPGFFFSLAYLSSGSRRLAALALGVYFAGVLCASLNGRFPVPLLGYGLSPIVGYFLAAGWLALGVRPPGSCGARAA